MEIGGNEAVGVSFQPVVFDVVEGSGILGTADLSSKSAAVYGYIGSGREIGGVLRSPVVERSFAAGAVMAFGDGLVTVRRSPDLSWETSNVPTFGMGGLTLPTVPRGVLFRSVYKGESGLAVDMLLKESATPLGFVKLLCV